MEKQLSKFIEKILPKESKTYKKKLLDYPGVLSSFSAKIELAFAFRLISENLYTSLNSLRKIRNEAAHSSHSFSIKEVRTKFEEVFDLGPSIMIFIRNKAINIMVNMKLENINQLFEEHKLTDEQKREQLKRLAENKELMEELDDQVTLWELIYGLSLICGIIKHEEEQTLKLLGNALTWNSLNRKLNNKEESVTK